MVMSEPVTAAAIDERLATISNLFVASRDDARLVVSQAGLFVLVGDVGGVVGASDGASELARATRVSLGDVMMPTPLIESVVVSREKSLQPIESLVVFLYLLDDLMTTGQRLDDFGVNRIANMIEAGEVGPGWRPIHALMRDENNVAGHAA